MEKMKIKLNNKFYKKEAIIETIKKFEEIADCKIINNSFEVQIESDDSAVFNEFCNFVLGFTKDKMLF